MGGDKCGSGESACTYRSRSHSITSIATTISQSARIHSYSPPVSALMDIISMCELATVDYIHEYYGVVRHTLYRRSRGTGGGIL